jgi:hypothetical protein
MESTDVYGLVAQDRVDHVRRMLAQQGVAEDRIEVVPAPPGRYQLHDETLHHDAASARRGAALGLLVGIVVGTALALLLPQVDTTATAVGTALAFAGFGGLVGGMVGLQRVEHDDADPVGYREVTAADGVVLVKVHDQHWHNRVHRILERHGAVFLQAPEPV